MGIEPTQNGVSALLTVLKTAEPTRALPPPLRETYRQIPSLYYTFMLVSGSRNLKNIH